MYNVYVVLIFLFIVSLRLPARQVRRLLRLHYIAVRRPERSRVEFESAPHPGAKQVFLFIRILIENQPDRRMLIWIQIAHGYSSNTVSSINPQSTDITSRISGISLRNACSTPAFRVCRLNGQPTQAPVNLTFTVKSSVTSLSSTSPPSA
jgi:hypothetical protein